MLHQRDQEAETMRFMFLMAGHDGPDLSPDEIRAIPEFAAWEAELRRRGISHDGEKLRPPSEAITVRVRDGELLLTDGPFAETKEQFGGYEVIDCRDLAEAIELAAKHPGAAGGVIEVRPIWPD
jgi:hypothetical protein